MTQAEREYPIPIDPTNRPVLPSENLNGRAGDAGVTQRTFDIYESVRRQVRDIFEAEGSIDRPAQPTGTEDLESSDSLQTLVPLPPRPQLIPLKPANQPSEHIKPTPTTQPYDIWLGIAQRVANETGQPALKILEQVHPDTRILPTQDEQPRGIQPEQAIETTPIPVSRQLVKIIVANGAWQVVEIGGSASGSSTRRARRDHAAKSAPIPRAISLRDLYPDDDYPTATVSPMSGWLGRLASSVSQREAGKPYTIGEHVKTNNEMIIEHERAVRTSGVVAAVIGKGSSTVTAYSAALLAKTTDLDRPNIVVVDADPTGVIGTRFSEGIEGDPSKFTLKELAMNIRALPRLESEGQRLSDVTKYIRKMIQPSTHGVRILTAKPNHKQTDGFNDADMKQTLQAVDASLDHQFYDMGSVLSGADELNTHNQIMLDRSNVFVFSASANVNERATLRQLRASMHELRTLAGGKYAERVNRSIVILSDLEPAQDIKEFREYFFDLDDEGEVTDNCPYQGSVVGVPYTEALTKNDEAIVDLRLLSPGKIIANLKPLEAYQNLVIAILEERKRQIDSSNKS